MDKLLLVAAGGATGAVMRYLTGMASLRLLGPGWPWGTLTVNVVGGLAMGLLAATLALRGGADQERWRVLLGVGVLGGFTTFSAFSLEVTLMIERKEWPQAFGYSTLSVILSVVALFAGLMLARRILHP
ncbi:MAG: fluoride efflux transporter CrcB [Caulobacterales bacterium]|nr:fluoride efflux transporter CrcB [Caulobacterales bacterium]